MTGTDLILFHNPQSRSAGSRVLLETLDVPYTVRFVDFASGQNRRPDFLALNPLGKLPTLVHDGVVVTEQVAITLYLADRFSAGRLAPALDDPLRGPYLRWLAFYGACFEPALVDHACKRAPIDASTAPYRDYDAVIGAVVERLSQGPWFLGERFTAADVLWGSALRWTTGFGIVPKLPVVTDYIERVTRLPGFVRAAEKDAALLAETSAAKA